MLLKYIYIYIYILKNNQMNSYPNKERKRKKLDNKYKESK